MRKKSLRSFVLEWYVCRRAYILWIIAVTLPNTTACIIAGKHTKQINIKHKRGLKRMLFNRGREREMFYLTMHSTHFIYGYMASDIWLRTILILRKETRCCQIGYSYRLSYILWIIAVTLPNTTACIIAGKHVKQINIIKHKRGLKRMLFNRGREREREKCFI